MPVKRRLSSIETKAFTQIRENIKSGICFFATILSAELIIILIIDDGSL